jgi:Fe-S cluster assembly protein SufD
LTMETQVIDMTSYTSISKAKQEPAWLSQMRAEAFALASKLNLPKLEKMRIEQWDLGSLGAYRQGKAADDVKQLPEELAVYIGEHPSPNLLVQHDSSVVYVRLSPELEKQGVILKSLEQAAADHPELVQQHLMQAVKMDENRLTALHAALWNGGLFLYVPKNVVIEEPIQAIFYSESAESTFAPHVLIVADENSKVTYVDNYVSKQAEQQILHPGVIEVFGKPNAQLRIATVHDLSQHVTDINYRRAVLDKDARVEWIVGDLSRGNSVSETYSILKGDGSTSDMKVISVGVGTQQLNYTTRAVHFGKSSASDMITRAVMRDEASAIINGITKIEHGATKADGQQTERVLMLSPKARGDANPILLIEENDVSAGHAASVGKVNPEQVYYLMSRGISRDEAERLIIYGFLDPVIEEIPLERLRDQLRQLVERKIGR